MKKTTILILFLLLSGCGTTPFVEWDHISDPRLDNDGLDLVCGGTSVGGKLSASVAVCKDLWGGELIKTQVRYEI